MSMSFFDLFVFAWNDDFAQYRPRLGNGRYFGIESVYDFTTMYPLSKGQVNSLRLNDSCKFPVMILTNGLFRTPGDTLQ